MVQITASDLERIEWVGGEGCLIHLDELWKDQQGCLVAPRSISQVIVCGLHSMTHRGKNELEDVLDC